MKIIYWGWFLVVFLLFPGISYSQKLTDVKFESEETHEPVKCIFTITYSNMTQKSPGVVSTFVPVDLGTCFQISCTPQDGNHKDKSYTCAPIIYLELLDKKEWINKLKFKKKYEEKVTQNDTHIERIGLNKSPVSKGTFN